MPVGAGAGRWWAGELAPPWGVVDHHIPPLPDNVSHPEGGMLRYHPTLAPPQDGASSPAPRPRNPRPYCHPTHAKKPTCESLFPLGRLQAF